MIPKSIKVTPYRYSCWKVSWCAVRHWDEEKASFQVEFNAAGDFIFASFDHRPDIEFDDVRIIALLSRWSQKRLTLT